MWNARVRVVFTRTGGTHCEVVTLHFSNGSFTRRPAHTLDQRSISIKMDQIFSSVFGGKKEFDNRKNLRSQIWKGAPNGVFYSWDGSVWKKIRREFLVQCLEINRFIKVFFFFLTCTLYSMKTTGFSVELLCHKNESKTFESYFSLVNTKNNFQTDFYISDYENVAQTIVIEIKIW